MTRPIFCGNFDFETRRQSYLELLFSRYGRVERVEMKSGNSKRILFYIVADSHISSGFAFVYFEDERVAEDAIRGLDNIHFWYDRRRLSVEWASGERGKHGDGRAAKQRPTKTLFVINFDAVRTRERDIERHFEPYGMVLNVRVCRIFAFVQFETQEDATKALECTHMSRLLDRVVSVEYALRDDDEKGGRYDRRSPSTGPDYGRARIPVYDRYNGPSHERARSPEYGRYRSRSPVRRPRT